MLLYLGTLVSLETADATLTVDDMPHIGKHSLRELPMDSFC
jgi:hypothetical protein